MRQRLIRAGAWVAITVAIFLVLEGAANVVLFLRALQTNLRPARVLAERKHATFDAELGWVNTPNLSLPDFYGPGKDMVINSQGFRDQRDFETSVPNGMLRVICTGDSFTLGYGESSENTWCARLAAMVPNVETVNMGQGGYGVDQMYLWYMRDGLDLEHDAQVLAFIYHDFERMGYGRFGGYSKPSMRLVDGQLQTRPASQHNGEVWRWLNINGRLFAKLASVRLAERAMRRLSALLNKATEHERIWTTAEAIFDSLVATHCRSHNDLVLVFLPDSASVGTRGAYWRHQVADYAQRHSVTYFDLVTDLQEVPMAEAQSFFDSIHYHYSRRGNNWVAGQLSNWLEQRAKPEGKVNQRPCTRQASTG